MAYPGRVRLSEVGPRDGLQNEKTSVAAPVKIELIRRLVHAGLTSIEATAFVSPKWVPQMSDNAAVMAGVPRRPDVAYSALTPNLRGFEAAMAGAVDEVSVFGAASETFSRRNINCSISESLERFAPVCEAAKARAVPVRGYVSCVLGCPFEGEVPTGKVVEVAATLFAMGCDLIGLGDTIGTGTPTKARAVVEAVAAEVSIDRIVVHFHDTYGQALANILAVMDLGVAAVDSAVGGLGGCPYAAGASGNVATEDVVYMLDGMGIETGVDIEAVVETAWFAANALGREPASRVAHALRDRSARIA